MKRIISISIIAFAALLLAGCQKEAKEFAPAPTANELSSLIKIGEQFTITASKEVDETKTVLSGNDVLWLPGDQITLVYGNADNYSTGVFTADITTPSATATFTGTLQMVVGSAEAISGGSSDAENYLYGVFPASAEVGLTKNYNNTIDLLTVPFKSDQTAVDGSFDKSAFTSCGRSSNLSLKFFNINSVLAIKVEEEGVTSLMVENIDKSLGGIGTTTQKMRFYSDSEIAEWGSSGITHMVSLLPPEGEDTFTKGNTYYMVVVANTFKKGVTFTMATASGPKEMLIPGPITAERSKIHNVSLKAQELTVERVWGKFPTEWPNFTNNLDRCATTDGEYVYVAKAGAGQKGIWAINIEDPTQIKEVCMDGVEDEGTFYTSCVRTIYNPSTDKYILLLSNLSLTGGEHLYLYAYVNGIDAAPTKLLYDYTLPTWAERRFGDFFTVVGNWQNGYIWFRTNTSGASTTARFTISNGVLTSQTPDGFNYGYGASQGKGSFYQYDMSAKLGLLVTDSIGMFYDLNSSEGQEWNSPATTENMRRMFGITPFRFCGHNYIAYTKMKDDNAARSWLRIISDLGYASAFKASLEANNIIYQAAIQIDEEGQSTNVMSGATYSDQTSASCAVAVLNDCVIIIGHHHNVGLSVFKMYMK